MGFVVELTSRTGRVLELLRFDKPHATVGRGYDNDIILNDPYVDAHHLRIGNSLDGLSVRVLSDTGHTLIDKAAPSGDSHPIASGTQVVAGKTHLRVLSSAHEVAPVLAFERIDQLFSNLSRPVAAVALTLLFILLAAANQYLDTVSEIVWSRWIMQLITPLLLAAGWATVWALVTRVARGEARFFHHWLAVLLFLLLGTVFEFVTQILRFNFGGQMWIDVFDWVAGGICLALLFWLHLRFAFRQSKVVRHVAAQTLAWSVVAYGVLSTFSFTRDFMSYPEFESALLPTSFLLRDTASSEEYLVDSAAMFEFSEAELAVSKEEEASDGDAELTLQ